MPDELTELAKYPQFATWIGGLIVAGYVIKLLAQASETVAGMLGKLGERWQAQKAASVERAKAAQETDNAMLADMKAQLDHFSDRVVVLDHRLGQMMVQNDLYADYIAWDAEWHATADILRATGDPLPIHMTFAEYKARRSPNNPA
ncbi:gp19 [Rhodococcus phage ReqiPine5]|uniref:Gp19 n=1 Tax=Rhodococcus phage ReqiPine5 TaxID=691963 RepID=D4P7Z4_9CAUD|nr:gp19 [Rhodococcus phage ReqiPine5]ADD81124.1 gp19 [Rhodococcus phage ReqiPine5]